MFEDRVLKQLEDDTPKTGRKALMQLVLQLLRSFHKNQFHCCAGGKKRKGGFESSQSVALLAQGTPSQLLKLSGGCKVATPHNNWTFTSTGAQKGFRTRNPNPPVLNCQLGFS